MIMLILQKLVKSSVPYEIQAEYHRLSQLLINNNYSDLKRALNITDKIESYSIKQLLKHLTLRLNGVYILLYQ